MAITKDRLYLAPEDQPARLFEFRIPWEKPWGKQSCFKPVT
jgi:hypothetical protein